MKNINHQLDQLVRLKNWSDALFILEAKKKSSTLSKSEIMTLGLIYFNLQNYDLGFASFKTISWDNYSDCAWLRRMVIAPLISTKNFIWAVELLELILQTHPRSVLDLTTLSSVLIRQNQRTEGCVCLEKILAIEKDNYSIAAQLIQLKLQDNKLDEAVNLAKQYEYAYDLNERLLKIALLTLSRAGNLEPCIKHLYKIDVSKHSLDTGVLAAQIAFDGQDYSLAKSIISQLLALDHEDARIYLISAKITLLIEKNESDAILTLIRANELDPENIQVNNLLGDVLLRTGHYSQSLTYLEKLKTLLPDNTHTRLLNARALKFTGDYEKAANEMLEVIRLQPNSAKWKRYAAAALVQAGRTEEAKNIFEEGVTIRNKKLPATFESGLSQLSQKIAAVSLPPARFDWLWGIINTHGSLDNAKQGFYEKAAKWVYLLDHYLLDWLECRPHQADEAMVLFDDLSEKNVILNKALSTGKGIILASAHIGPLYAGPLALELLGLPHKWLASTPSISSMPYHNTLISTSENTETEVVRQIIKSLRQGDIITIAVDGAMNPSAPKIEFEGQQVTYSDFAARVSFRTKAPSFFAIPFWEKERFCFDLQELPMPSYNENIEEFCSRWTQNFLCLLRNFLVNNPSNARLSGGIWRYIR